MHTYVCTRAHTHIHTHATHIQHTHTHLYLHALIHTHTGLAGALALLKDKGNIGSHNITWAGRNNDKSKNALQVRSRCTHTHTHTHICYTNPSVTTHTQTHIVTSTTPSCTICYKEVCQP